MQAPEPAPGPAPEPEASPVGEPPAPAAPPPPRREPGAHTWLWATVAALLAGALAWACQEQVYGHFQPQYKLPANFATLGPYEKPTVLAQLIAKATPASESKNTALAYGLLGAA